MATSTKPYAVVTGASSGIGLELAKQFALNGFDLLIASQGEGIHDAARDLEALGAQVTTSQVDLADHEGIHKLISDLAEEMNMVRLNVLSVLHLLKYMAKDMIARGSGRILITSSIAATMPTPYEAVYGATKAFERSLAQSVREELKDTGVTVTALMPGATETRFFERAGVQDTKLGAGEKDDPAQVAKEGFEAMMAGKDHVVAGSLKNKFQAAAGYALPDPLVAKAHAGMAAPGSAKK